MGKNDLLVEAGAKLRELRKREDYMLVRYSDNINDDGS